MISLQEQIFQLIMGLFLGSYLSIVYHYFNQFFSSKKKHIKKNLYDFMFIILNLLLVISFLERNAHGIIRFYPLALLILSFLLIQFFIKDSLNKSFTKVYLLSLFTVKYLKLVLNTLFISKTSVILLNRVLRLINSFSKYVLFTKNKTKKDNSF